MRSSVQRIMDTISFRLPKQDADLIKQQASDLDLTLSDYIRSKLIPSDGSAPIQNNKTQIDCLDDRLQITLMGITIRIVHLEDRVEVELNHLTLTLRKKNERSNT